MLTIGKVAKLTGFSASAIRYYERLGLLRASRLPNGYRFYDEAAIKVLLFLRQAQTLGITLKEIKRAQALFKEIEAFYKRLLSRTTRRRLRADGLDVDRDGVGTSAFKYTCTTLTVIVQSGHASRARA